MRNEKGKTEILHDMSMRSCLTVDACESSPSTCAAFSSSNDTFVALDSVDCALSLAAVAAAAVEAELANGFELRAGKGLITADPAGSANEFVSELNASDTELATVSTSAVPVSISGLLGIAAVAEGRGGSRPPLLGVAVAAEAAADGAVVAPVLVAVCGRSPGNALPPV